MLPPTQHQIWQQNYVGKRYVGWNGQTYLCESYDFQGFWMRNVSDPSDRRNISPRAIGSTFHSERENVE